MTESEKSKLKEEKAVQALISAALHVGHEEVTAEEMGPYLSGEAVLSAEDDAALKRLKSDSVSPQPQTNLPPQETMVETEEFMALHRKQPGQGFSPKTEEEIKRKREELLEKLRKKKGSG
jgi:hypothetical protein